MALKYQAEIDNFGLSLTCPDNVEPPNGEIDAYRFSYNPINHHLNFLPNVVFDRLTKNPYNYNKASDHIKCSRCGASYYTSIENVKTKWALLSEQIRENLGYTHIAFGKLNNTDGLMKKPAKTGHFGFYENDTVDLSKKFSLVSEL